MAGLQAIQITLLVLLLSVAAVAALARKLQTPYPVLLVVAGLIFSFIPGMPRVTLDPNIVFFVVLPPLLYSAAWNTSWKDFRQNLVTITFLAIGLVGFTVLSVAVTAPFLFPGFDWRIGFVLGAVVATTDSIAATSIAHRIGLPKRIVDVLEGESLVNDATGLLALEFGIAMVVNGQTPTAAFALFRLLYLSLAGLGVGLMLGAIVEWFERRIDDGPIEIAVSIFVPYSAYLAGELIQASGVLSVVAAGLDLGRKSERFYSPGVRLQANAVWNALTFIINGLVFLVIGLQLPYVLGQIRGLRSLQILFAGALFSVFLIFLRLLWTFPGALLASFVCRRLLHEDEPWPGARSIFVIGWTGMRGVIALAAAVSLPQSLMNGSPFSQRSLIILLTFSVILVTLVLQGLTLPTVILALGLGGAEDSERSTREARRLVIEAALEHLRRMREASPDFADVDEDIAQHYEARLASLQSGQADADGQQVRWQARYLDVSQQLLNFERDAVLRLRKEGCITSEALKEIQRDLDLSVVRLNILRRSVAP